jgi:hypothetical protein
MRTKLISTLSFALVLSACGQPEPISYETLVWVNNYYIEHPAGSLSATAGGWLFRGAKEAGNDIKVNFVVPGSINQNPAIRQAILSSICPAKSEVIWQALRSNTDLVINVWTEDNKVKDSVVC